MPHPLRLPGVPRSRKGRRRFTAAERRALKPRPISCVACGRALKNRASIKARIGPRCAAKRAREAAAARVALPFRKGTP